MGLKFTPNESEAKQCQVCDGPILADPNQKTGRPPTTCHLCKGVLEEEYKGWLYLKGGQALGNSQRLRNERRDGGRKTALAKGVMEARKLAVMLRTTEDPRKAAKLAGINLANKSKEEIDQLFEDALADDLKGLREGRREVTANTVGAVLAIFAERLMENAHEIPASNIPNSMNQLAKTVEQLGGFKQTFGVLKVDFTATVAQTQLLETLRAISGMDDVEKIRKTAFNTLNSLDKS